MMTWTARHSNTNARKLYESIDGQKLKDIHSSNGKRNVQYFMFKDAVRSLVKAEDTVS